MLERLQKILSHYGISARRKAEDLIRSGRVSVNGKVAAIGQKADLTTDRIEVDGAILKANIENIYYLMYKPRGVETTNRETPHLDPLPPAFAKATAGRQGEGKYVRDLLPSLLRGKVFPVGRLDKDSEGLLLFTNDGELKYRLEHPKFDHEKEYEVELVEPIFDGALQKLEKGVTLDGAKTKPARIKRLGPKNFRIALTEGRNRQIRRMCQKVGSAVIRLWRVRIMNLQDEKLQQGKGRMLSLEEVQRLRNEVGLESQVL